MNETWHQSWRTEVGQFECSDEECGVCHICQEPHKTSQHHKEFVYQLHAEGETLMGFSHKNFTKTVFTTEEAAEARIPKFREFLCDTERVFALIDNSALKITVVPLEIIREEKCEKERSEL